MISIYISIAIFLSAGIALYIFRNSIRKWAYQKKTTMQLGTLRGAIHAADDNKEKTGRKNMVIFNSTQSSFEPIQKKQLKAITKFGKNTSNKAMTKGRKKMMDNKKRRSVSVERSKQIEKSSLYVTT